MIRRILLSAAILVAVYSVVGALYAQVPFATGKWGLVAVGPGSGGGAFTGAVSFADGTSCTAPAITNSGDTDTGLAFDTNNQINMCAGSVNSAQVSATAVTSAVGVTYSAACGANPTSDTVCADNNGVFGGQRSSDVAPQDLAIRPQTSFAGGTQTAADVNIFGGQDETLCAIDGADPSVSCAGDNDTITVTVINSNGSSTATVLTEGTEWTASASVATTCASLASAVDALAGVGASCTSPNVLFTLDAGTGAVTLAESTAGCTTVSTGTSGFVSLRNGATESVRVSATSLLLASGSVVQFGGTSSSEVMLKRSTATLETKLADDSAYATHVGLAFQSSASGLMGAMLSSGSGGAFLGSGKGLYWSSTTAASGGLDLGAERAEANFIKLTNGSSGLGGISSWKIKEADLTAGSCTAGAFQLDTGGATKELCYCQVTNTWYCWSVTTVTGPTD